MDLIVEKHTPVSYWIVVVYLFIVCTILYYLLFLALFIVCVCVYVIGPQVVDTMSESTASSTTANDLDLIYLKGIMESPAV